MQEFHFLYPWWLLLLLPLALLLWQLRRYRDVRGGEWNRVVDPRLQPYVIVPGESVGRQRSWWLIGLAGLIAIIALAGPAWKKLPQPVHQLQSPLVILLDLSTSMYAKDQKPSRLTRARFELSDLLRARKEGQTALIVYAGDAFAVTPLTEDNDNILAQVKALSPAIMPVPGSRADLALSAAEKLFEQAGIGSGDILLLTDDIPNPARAASIARNLATRDYTLSILGIGTEEGAPVPLPRGGFLKDRQGAMIVAKLEMEQLQQVAEAGGGIAIESSAGDSDLQQLQSRFSRHQRIEESDPDNPARVPLWRNEGIWLLLLLIPLAALSFRRGWVLMLAFVMLQPAPSQAFEWSQLWQDLWLRSDQQAQRALDAGQPAEAAEKFSDPASKGVANYLAKNYQQSIEDLQQLDGASATYNRGNALARLQKYREAIKAYDQTLKADTTHENARYNRDLVMKELEKQQQNQQSRQQDQQQQQSEEQQQSDSQQQSDQQQERSEQQQESESRQQSEQQQESDSQQQSDQEQSEQEQQSDSQQEQDEQQQESDSQQQSEQQQSEQEQQSDSQQQEKEQDEQQQESDSQQQSEQEQQSDSQQQEKEQDEQQQESDSQQQEQDEQQQESDSQQQEKDKQQQQEAEQREQQAAEQQAKEQERQRQQEQQERERQQREQEQNEQQQRQSRRDPKLEQEQASEQWLRQIPDDPAGLWRRKFEYQYRRRRGVPQEQSW